jgi:hypothetical protein
MSFFSEGNHRFDSAWAKVVAGAAFVLMFLTYGAAYSFGIFSQP